MAKEYFKIDFENLSFFHEQLAEVESYIKDKFFTWIDYENGWLIIDIDNCNFQLLFTNLESILYLKFGVFLINHLEEYFYDWVKGINYNDYYPHYQARLDYSIDKLKNFIFTSRDTDFVTKKELITGDY